MKNQKYETLIADLMRSVESIEKDLSRPFANTLRDLYDYVRENKKDLKKARLGNDPRKSLFTKLVLLDIHAFIEIRNALGAAAKKRFRKPTRYNLQSLLSLQESCFYNEDREKLRVHWRKMIKAYNHQGAYAKDGFIFFAKKDLNHLSIYFEPNTSIDEMFSETDMNAIIYGNKDVGFKKFLLRKNRELFRSLEKLLNSNKGEKAYQRNRKIRLLQALRSGNVSLKDIEREMETARI
jgi:hypothetical protein